MLFAEFPSDGYPSILPEPDNKTDVRCIDGAILGRSKCPWYCNSTAHPGYLTQTLAAQHNCHEKFCSFLYRVLNHDKIKTAQARQKKSDLKAEREALTKTIEEKARVLTKNLDGFKIVRVESPVLNEWVVSYVSLGACDFTGIIPKMNKEFSIKTEFRRLEYDYDRIVALLLK